MQRIHFEFKYEKKQYYCIADKDVYLKTVNTDVT